MSEINAMRRILLALGGRPNTRLFRNNVGMGWAGRVIKRTQNNITLTDYRPLHAGLVKGSSDLIGWNTVEITPDMVGRRIAVFTAIEVKAGPRSRRTPEQVAFIEAVNTFGGIAGVVTNEDEATQIITTNQ